MIPTMIVFGLALGHWWRAALVVGTVLWPTLLLATGVIGFDSQVIPAALLGLANTAVGVAVHQAVAWTVRRIRPRRSRAAVEPPRS